jgi:uncharacterized protein
MKALILPGNGNCDINSMWYSYVKSELEKRGYEVIAENMPDPELARSEFWLPFMEEKLGGDRNVLLIGHSSGAVAIQRYLETHACHTAVLVGTCHTDLNEESERLSGYYDAPWDWDAMKKNAKRIIIFASTDDPFISVSEPQFIAKQLDADYREFTDQGHFQDEEFPELISALD